MINGVLTLKSPGNAVYANVDVLLNGSNIGNISVGNLDTNRIRYNGYVQVYGRIIGSNGYMTQIAPTGGLPGLTCTKPDATTGYYTLSYNNSWDATNVLVPSSDFDPNQSKPTTVNWVIQSSNIELYVYKENTQTNENIAFTAMIKTSS